MRPCIRLSSLLAAIAIAASACGGERVISGPDIEFVPGATFSGIVATARSESVNGLAGSYFLYDVRFLVAPLSTDNVDVRVPISTPVFVRRDGALKATDASAIRVGDRIMVSSDPDGGLPLLATEIIIKR